VLLVKRSKAPSDGQWAIPGGSVNIGESLQQAAERELKEETGIVIKGLEPVYTFDVIDRDGSGQIRYHYVIVDLIGEYIAGEPSAGDDALDAQWVTKEQLQQLNVNHRTLRLLSEKFRFGPQGRKP
jgi:ADP-ribose pyrophosphatase